MKLHMVVVSYRTPSDLEAFCRSVEMFPPTTVDWSLTVVNVAPEREDIAVAGRWADRLGVLHYWNPENIGYGRACNEGARWAEWDRGEEGVLAFFNADVVLSLGAVDGCARGLLSHRGWGVLGPRQVNRQNRLTHAGIFGTLRHPKHRGWQSLGDTHHGGPLYVDVRDDAITVSGAAYFVRRSLWDELRCCPMHRQIAPDARGAFLPTPHYFEETWVSYHAHAHGWKVVYWGADTVLHEWHQASKVGGYAEQQFPVSQRMFRAACDLHGIPHD